jgi:hypothetical protein
VTGPGGAFQTTILLGPGFESASWAPMQQFTCDNDANDGALK